MFRRAASLLTNRSAGWRLFWTVVLLAHLRATHAAFASLFHGGAGTTDWTRLLFLSTSNLFFILEVSFAPGLRLVSDRRAVIAFLIIVAVMHAGVIERGMPDVVFARDSQLWLLLSTVGAIGCEQLLRPTLLRLLTAMRAPAAPPPAMYARPGKRAAAPLRELSSLLSFWNAFALRAPPLRA